jgi:hypothetical protein
MTFGRMFLSFLALIGVLMAASSAGTQTRCPPGEVRAPLSGGCMPAGAVDCGGGGYCLPGKRCTPSGGCTGGTPNTGPMCGSGRCPEGNLCGSAGHCYDPRTTYICGTAFCRKGFRYDSGPCTACSGVARPARKPAYDCETCHQKLMADIRSGWASGRLRTYVAQAIAGYENCKRKAAPNCMQGDILVRTIRNACDAQPDEDAYRACVGRIVP